MFAQWVAVAYMFYQCDRLMGGQFDSFQGSLWWSFATITTLGYGDFYAITQCSRGVAVVGVVIGVIVLSGLFSAVVGFLTMTPRDKKILDFMELSEFKTLKFNLAAACIQRAWARYKFRKYSALDPESYQYRIQDYYLEYSIAMACAAFEDSYWAVDLFARNNNDWQFMVYMTRDVEEKITWVQEQVWDLEWITKRKEGRGSQVPVVSQIMKILRKTINVRNPLLGKAEDMVQPVRIKAENKDAVAPKNVKFAMSTEVHQLPGGVPESNKSPTHARMPHARSRASHLSKKVAATGSVVRYVTKFESPEMFSRV